MSSAETAAEKAPGHYLGTASVFFPKKDTDLLYEISSQALDLLYLGATFSKKKMCFFPPQAHF
jgi:hypothetical protein